jgi:hypothetical protein
VDVQSQYESTVLVPIDDEEYIMCNRADLTYKPYVIAMVTHSLRGKVWLTV